MIYFPVANIYLNPAIPVLTGILFGLIFGKLGLTGTILTLPFMITFLNFQTLSITPTNLAINLIAPIGGVYGYTKEKRMFWALAIFIGIGALMGASSGAFLRVNYIKSTFYYNILITILMLFFAIGLMRTKGKELKNTKTSIKTQKITIFKLIYIFGEEKKCIHTFPLIVLGTLVGFISSAIGLGGAFIIVPLLCGIFHLSIYEISGATIFFNCIASTIGLLSYIYLLPIFGKESIKPDWGLAVLFGIGLLIGGYISARIQKFFKENFLRLILSIIIIFWASFLLIQTIFGG